MGDGNEITPLLAKLLNETFNREDSVICDRTVEPAFCPQPSAKSELSCISAVTVASAVCGAGMKIGAAAPSQTDPSPPAPASQSIEFVEENLKVAMSVTGIENNLNQPRKNVVQRGEPSFACRLCSYKALSMSCVKDHERTHSGEKPFACSECAYSCNVVSNLKRHFQVRHKSTIHVSTPFKCDSCGFGTDETCLLRQHVEKCRWQRAKSPEPERRAKLITRRKSMPNIEMCRILEFKPEEVKVYESKPVLPVKRKQQLISRNEVPEAKKSLQKEDIVPMKTEQQQSAAQKIPERLVTSNQPSLLTNNRPNSTETVKKQYFCSTCNFNTSFQVNWKLHLRKRHRELYCLVCNKEFSSSQVLDIHYDVCHSIPTSCILPSEFSGIDVTAIELKKPKTRQRICKLCGFSTYQAYEFDAHEQRHVTMEGWRQEQRVSFDIINLKGECLSEVVFYSQ